MGFLPYAFRFANNQKQFLDHNALFDYFLQNHWFVEREFSRLFHRAKNIKVTQLVFLAAKINHIFRPKKLNQNNRSAVCIGTDELFCKFL